MAQAGLVVEWGATHRHNGVIVVRFASITPPEAIKCLKVSCLWGYLKESLRYVLVTLYHKHRIIYAETHRDEDIPARYRMGEPSPDTIWKTVKEIIRLQIRR